MQRNFSVGVQASCYAWPLCRMRLDPVLVKLGHSASVVQSVPHYKSQNGALIKYVISD